MSSSHRKNEALGIGLFFCAVILALFFYFPSTGIVGAFFKSLGFGLLGVSAHVLPVFIAYAAIDLFLEKRANVSRVRVRSVIFLMICVSAIFAAITMDFDYLKTLSVIPAGTKFSAFKACQLLWQSGMDGKLITPPNSTLNVIPGGLIGGMISTAIASVCGRVVTCILLIGFTLTQIVYIFQISVKSTAKAIGTATKKQIANYRDNVNNRGKASAYTKDILPPKPSYGVPATPVSSSSSTYMYGAGGSTVIINPAVTDVPILKGDPVVSENPFDVRKETIDDYDGYISWGDNEAYKAGFISYGEKEVSTSETTSGTADFSFNATPKSINMTSVQPKETITFGKKEPSQKDFYSLDPEANKTSAINNETDSKVNSVSKPTLVVSHYDDASDDEDMPFEITGDYSEEEQSFVDKQGPGVRTPNVPVNLFDYSSTNDDLTTPVAQQINTVSAVTPSVAPASTVNNKSVPATTVVNNTVPSNEPAVEPVLRSDITINTAKDVEGVSNTEGRAIDTTSRTISEHVEPEVPQQPKFRGRYKPAPTNLLSGDPPGKNASNDIELRTKAAKLEEALKSFGIEAKVVDITYGPAITRFELTLKTGIKVSRVLSLTDDIQLAMAAISVRIEAPIPGKSAIGIEIPNDKITAVHLRNLLETREFKESSPLTVALGRDIPGKPILCDLAKMPHLLVAGSTGSGKSVCINSILLSILCKATPDEVKLILIDPKQVELSIYNGIPHLITPVVVDPKKATNALKWAVQEMNLRYQKFAENHVRNMSGYNDKAVMEGLPKMPLILLVIDEFADIMTVAAKEVEEQVMRLAAMARAAGIHMILATQRPSVDVITGVLKNNMPSRIAFAVTSGVDSRTILDSVGAEKLLGKGDMLYAPQSSPKPIRGQGAFVPDEEVEKVIEFLRKFGTNYDDNVNSFINNVSTENSSGGAGASAAAGDAAGEDDLLEQAVDIVIDANVASVSILQRKLGIGYPRAARLIDVMEQHSYIGPFEGSKPRKVLITKTDWLEIKARK